MNKPEFTPDSAEENCIVQFQHCAKCLKEKPPGVSPKEWSQVQVGFSIWGIQIWCNRHEANVMHIDFEGAKHRAVTTCKK